MVAAWKSYLSLAADVITIPAGLAGIIGAISSRLTPYAIFVVVVIILIGLWLWFHYRISQRQNSAGIQAALGALTFAVLLVVLWQAGSALADTVSIWKQQIRVTETSPTIEQEINRLIYEYRSAMARAKTPFEKRDAERRFLLGWEKVEAEDISRVTRTPNPKRIYIYALSPDKKFLIPIASYGAAGYSLDANDSIAGCSLHNRSIVYWEGKHDDTHYIQLFRFDDEQVGIYDEEQKRLRLPKGSCQYDNREQNDPKVQLLCLPIGIDDSRSSPDVPGVLCLSVDKRKAFMTQPWLRSYLTKSSRILGMLQITGLATDWEEE